MKISIFGLIAFSSFVAHADGQRLYQTDKYGNIQYQNSSYVIQKNGRVVEVDKFGNKQYQKRQYQIKDDRVYQTDKYGNIQYNKPRLLIK